MSVELRSWKSGRATVSLIRLLDGRFKLELSETGFDTVSSAPVNGTLMVWLHCRYRLTWAAIHGRSDAFVRAIRMAQDGLAQVDMLEGL